MSVRNARAMSRQDTIKALFARYIEEERAIQKRFHAFCNWAAGKSHLEIERDLNNPNGMGFL